MCVYWEKYGVELLEIIQNWVFFQAEDGIRDKGSDWSSDVCSSDLVTGSSALVKISRPLVILFLPQFMEPLNSRARECCRGRRRFAVKSTPWVVVRSPLMKYCTP